MRASLCEPDGADHELGKYVSNIENKTFPEKSGGCCFLEMFWFKCLKLDAAKLFTFITHFRHIALFNVTDLFNIS